MSHSDLLGELLSGNPNAPATMGSLALLRMETQYEFRTLRSEVGDIRTELGTVKADVATLKSDVATLKSSVDLIAQHVVFLVDCENKRQFKIGG